ncbi:MAG: tetratricopeptide repeat protein, partial [Gemmatimonadota bacterium]|nr:tetratricopeptide repeat protein [Gemmatimonadota bacterium]
MASLYQRLSERKIFQWAVAYLAGAWLVLQVLDVFGDRWGLTVAVARTIDVALVVGFVATMLLAWYHGERGRQRVSGMEIVILAALLAVGGGVVALVGERSSGDSSTAGSPDVESAEGVLPVTDDRLSIAVLPFENMSADPANQYFSDGVSEEILNALAGIPGLRVPSRTSAFTFRGGDTPISEIGRRLQADLVLEGSVRKVGNRVRITAQLIDVDTDSHVWSETYERELEDIFAIQEGIASSIVQALPGAAGLDQPGLGHRERPTDDLEAYELFLQGLYQFHNSRDVPLAVELLEAAVERDPEFARAWAALSWAYVQRDIQSAGASPELLALAEEAADRALEIDPQLPAAHGALGWLRTVQTRWAEGERSLIRAIEAGAGDALPYLRYGTLLTDVGRTRAANEVLLRAAELDPLDGAVAHWLSDSYRNLGQWEESRLHGQRTLDLGLHGAGIGVYLYHLHEGDDEQAIETLERYEAMAGVDPAYVRPLVDAIR